MSWRVVPEAAKHVKFVNNSDFAKFRRWFFWNYMWDGKQYGLHMHDSYFYPAPEVREAVRRLSIAEPHEYDARQIRLMKAHNLAMHNEVLPKNKWTKWEHESWYLESYLNEIEEEKMQRSASTGLKAPWWHWGMWTRQDIETPLPK